MIPELKEKAIISRLDYKVGYSCNNNCLFCVVADKRQFKDRLTKDIKKELADSRQEGKREIVFTGGECTIRNDIFEIVSFAKSLGYRNIQIQSNGRKFASMDFCKRMLSAGMKEGGISLHGADSLIHDKLTRRKGSWRQSLLGINNLKKIKIKVLTNTVITRQNYKTLPEIARLLTRLKVNHVQFAFIHIIGNAMKYSKQIVPKVSDVIPFVTKAIDVCKRHQINVKVEAIPLCLLKGYEKYAAEFYIPNTQVKESHQTINDFEKKRITKGKIKFKKCLKCKFKKICEGPWREYPELFGNEEFIPVC